MSNSIKYNASAESLALNTGDFWIGTGDVGKGPTSTTGFWSAINPSNIDNDFVDGYTIYLNKENQGPSIYVAADDAELITIINQIEGTSYTDANQCFNNYFNQDDRFILNRYINPIITEGLRYYLDASLVPSYPRNGNDTYDLSGYAQDMTLSNSTFLNRGIEFNGTTTEAQGQLSSINADTNKTVLEVLFKPMDLSRQQAIFTDNYGPEYGIWVNTDSGGKISGYAYGGIHFTTPEIGRWYHVVLNIDPGAPNGGAADPTYSSMYVNGTLIGNKTTDTGNGLTDRPFTLGFDRVGDNPDVAFFSGSIDSVKIYYGEHGLTEVSQNYYQSKIVTDGLVYATDASNLVSYSDQSTTSFFPLTGSLPTGTLYNGTTTSNSSFVFDGVNDWAQFGVGNDIFPLDEFTIDIWVKSDGLGTGMTVGGIISLTYGCVLFITSTGNIRFGLNNSTETSIPTFTSSTNTFFNGEWHHITISNNGTTTNMYVNGALDTTSSQTWTGASYWPTNTLTLGQNNNNATVYRLKGEIGFPKIYDRVLTAAEVAQNYGAGVGRFSNTPIP